MKRIALALCFGALAALGLEAQPTAPTPATSAAASPRATTGYPAYRIGPRDLLALRIGEIPELDGDRRVADNGTIALPRVGDIEVAGLTQREAIAAITAQLEACCVKRATVELEIREYRSRPITLLGAVRQPGPLAFSGRWTLLEAIAAAGGLADSHGGTIFVLRRAENGLIDQVAISVDDLLIKADPRANIPIFANDLINVPATVEVTIYVIGEVAQPGEVVFTSSERITVLSVVARAGGLSDRASNAIIVRRKSGPNAGQDMKVDYRRIVNGREPDLQLGDGDVLIVKESFF